MTRNQKRRALREHRRKMRYVAEWRYSPHPANYEQIWREYEREVKDGLYA